LFVYWNQHNANDSGAVGAAHFFLTNHHYTKLMEWQVATYKKRNEKSTYTIR